MWAVRCVHESLMHERNSFVTLTYDEEHLPEDWSLDLRHWQLFRKRLREAIGPFRFFSSGEYGGARLRPHYHAIIFGEDFSGDRVLLREKPHRLWTSALLAEKWGMGHVSLGQVTPESCAYVTKYCVKKQRSLREALERVDADTGECWSVRREYVTMSRRPGLGARWIERFRSDVYPSDEVVVGGRMYRPPRYYDSKLPKSELEVLKVKRRRNAALREEDSSFERLRVRERVAESRLALLNR